LAAGEADVLGPVPPRVAAFQAEGTVPELSAVAEHGEWAICCSSSGIRAATYCLGALQGLDDVGLIGKARWLLGVSGGSSIAASYALVAHDLEQQAQSEQAASPQGSAGARVPDSDHRNDHADYSPHTYARDTPEEQYLRGFPSVAPGASTTLVGILSVLLGAAIIFVFAGAPVYALSHAWGWLLAQQGVLTWSGSKISASVTAWTWWLTPVVAAACTSMLFVRWRLTLSSGGPARGLNRARRVTWAALITLGLAVVMLAAPLLISKLFRSTGTAGTIAHFIGIGEDGIRQFEVLAGLVIAVAAVTWFGQRQLAELTINTDAENQRFSFVTALVQSVQSALPGWLGTPAAGLLYLLMFVVFLAGQLAAFFAAGLIIAAAVFAVLIWTAAGARTGFTFGQLWIILGALAVMLLTRVAVDVNQLSLHDFRRWRIAGTYAVTRRAAAETDPAHRQELLQDAALTRFSQLPNDRSGRALVICATTCASTQRDSPRSRRTFRLTFDPSNVTLCGLPSDERPEASAGTADYEHLVGHTRFTLFDLAAISDSAPYPRGPLPLPGGTVTRGVYRILLTATSMRSGFWLPHPGVVSEARAYLAAHPGPRGKDRWRWLALVWYVLPHPRWHNNHATSARNEARLWAHVLEFRESSAHPGSSRRARLLAALLWRAMQPTLGMLWAAAVGHASYRATWMYVTNGADYDNLGLVEALRRGATKILVLDASGDYADTWFSLGQAIAVARADQGVEISLDPTVMTMQPPSQDGPVPLLPGQVVRPWATGTFARRRSVPGLGNAGEIVICKPGWWRGAPWDVVAYAAGHPGYPDRITGGQFFDGTEFDAYRDLGVAAILDARAGGGLR